MQANVMTFYYIIRFYYISIRSSAHFITFPGVITDRTRPCIKSAVVLVNVVNVSMNVK